MRVNKLFFLLISLVFLSCLQNKSETIIEGKISNLPDGVLYLYEGNPSNRVDSLVTVKGSFTITYKLKKNNAEPVYLGLDHVDNNGTLRAFCFPTSSKYNNSGYNSQFFLSDSLVLINGSITDNTPAGIFVESTKFVTTPEVKAGYQTNALFHTDGDFFDNIDKDTYIKVISKIKEYPNSFHLLYQIANNRNSFSATEIQNLLNSFKGAIVDSETFKKLEVYNQKRFNKNKLTIPLLLDNNGNKTAIFDAKFKKHLVVFWASWCGPCRQEIPSLKKIYSKYKNNIEFVSVSIDSDNSQWQKALEKENMSWKQLIVNEKSNEYEPIEILFQLSTSIPYMVLMDNDMKVLKSHVGSMNEKELDNFINY